jgi:glycosyltransferase involved in cell wall biosynthesis
MSNNDPPSRTSGPPAEMSSSDRSASSRSETPIARSRPESSASLRASEKKGFGEQHAPLSNVLVGIPAYNEEIGIGSVVLATHQLTKNVLVVDDGSTDRTVHLAKEAGATVIEHDENRGKGAAIRTILDHAAGEEYDALVLLDGDGQHIPEEIPDVVKPVLEGTCDIAIGSRYIDDKRMETPLHRRFGQKVLDYATAALTGTGVSDSQSGFRAFSPHAIENLSLTTDGMGVESEMLGNAADEDLEVEEVPIDVRYEDVDGQTHNPLYHGFSVLFFVVKLLRNRHQLMFFGVFGLLLLLLGSGIGIHGLTIYRSGGTPPPWYFAVGGVAIVLAIVSLASGVVVSEIKNVLEGMEK